MNQLKNNQPEYPGALDHFEYGKYDDTKLDEFVDEKLIDEIY